MIARTIGLGAALLAVCAVSGDGRAGVIGDTFPESFSVCEVGEDARPECAAADVRLQGATSTASDFGFAVASGFLNGDDAEDLVIGDPARNRAYVFFGRPSVTSAYGLDPLEVADRAVDADTLADVIIERTAGAGALGFSVAISRRTAASGCGDDEMAGALLIGSPGAPGTDGNAPGRAFYLPPGALCMTAAAQPSPMIVDPIALGQTLRSPIVQDDDEFGYSVAFGRLATNGGDAEDAIVGARRAGDGGKVVVFPVVGGTALQGISQVIEIEGAADEGLGESLAVGDLDLDLDLDLEPDGDRDDLAIGAVGTAAGKVLLVRGPLSPAGGPGGDGVYDETDPSVRSVTGEQDGDFFGFGIAISREGRLAIGAVFADNDPAAGESTNIADAGMRINAGKAYLWVPPVLIDGETNLEASSADDVLVARRSGDQLGFALAFADLDNSGDDDLVLTARREDGSGLRVNEIDQGTAYIVFDRTNLTTPVDLGQCAANSNCTGVVGIDVMVFGGDRQDDVPDELGFAAATGDFNGDGIKDLAVSSRLSRRVYLVTLDDADDDRSTEGRNIRDDDDDGDGTTDDVDCDPLDPDISTGSTEIPCNGIDENCNGMDDDAPDADGDGFDACGNDADDIDPDCDDDDPASYPGATEVCDGNDNNCDNTTPSAELDLDGDRFVQCQDWDDTQGDQPDIIGGGDCQSSRADTFPGAAPNEATPEACYKDADDDDWGDAVQLAGITQGSDCNDGSAATFPGAAELDDVSACMADVDDDGYGDLTAFSPIVAGTDCNDNDPFSRPGADELCDGNDNDCDVMLPDDETDPDGDGWVACSPWEDVQGDNGSIQGGNDCVPDDGTVFPGAAPREAVPTACMQDADGDDYGALTPPAGAIAGTDCDDESATAAATFPGAAQIQAPLNCMRDVDDDGYGDDTAALPIVPGADCADDDASRFPGAIEIPGDGIDQDCNGTDTLTCFVDADGDGFGSTSTIASGDGDCDDAGESAVDTDCDDDDSDVYPGQTEIVDDAVDQDCNGFDTITCIVDGDGDGAGTPAGTTVGAPDGSCDAEDNESTTSDDCDDADPFSFPGAVERCDGNDNDCDSVVPTDESDEDGDTIVECAVWNDTQGDNPTISRGGDCDDTRSRTFPGAAENEPLLQACMQDFDEDGWGDIAPPPGVTPGTDCDDEGPTAVVTFPGAASADGPLNCMKDADGDDRGDATVSLPIVSGSDCDDDDAATYGGATEVCDGNDNDCDSIVPGNELDGDGDRWVACTGWNDAQGDDPTIDGGGDCDDLAANTFPGVAANEAIAGTCMRDADGDDWGDLTPPAGVTPGSDCDDDGPFAAVTFPGAAAIDGPLNCMKDADGDDYGDAMGTLPVVRGTDCNDDDATVSPGSPEGPPGDATCSDGVDNDCDTDVDLDDAVCAGTAIACPDADGDTWADCTTDPSCDSSGLVCGDCDDGAAAANPGATEVCDGIDNDCNALNDEGFDGDGDGFTTCAMPTPDCDDGNAAVNPGAVELCNDGIDNDCNAGTVDLFDGDGDGTTCDVDCNDADAGLNLNDGDGDSVTTCAGDCDDGNAAIAPGLPEACNDGLDNDCNAATPDVFDGDSDGADCTVDCNDNDAELNLDDADGDTFTTCAGDCNDGNTAVSPLATELCNGIDDDCDESTDENFDGDGDGFTTCAMPVPDCNDGNASVNPGAPEACNDGVDNDCNPATPDIFDGDSDGVSCVTDCNDSDSATFPGAAESCDGNDNDCGGGVPADETDPDGDGWVACTGWNDTQGDDPAIMGGGDCAEGSPVTFPGAAENEPFPGACMLDADMDGYGDQTPPPDVTAGSDCDDDGPFAADTFPGAASIEAPFNCMKDTDDDGYGDSAVSLPVVPGTDCDDDEPAANPGASEGPLGNATCSDGIDNDCDTDVDGADDQCSTMRRISTPQRAPGARQLSGPRFRERTTRGTRR